MDHFLQIGGEHVALGGDLDGCDSLPAGFTGIHDYEKLKTNAPISFEYIAYYLEKLLME